MSHTVFLEKAFRDVEPLLFVFVARDVNKLAADYCLELEMAVLGVHKHHFKTLGTVYNCGQAFAHCQDLAHKVPHLNHLAMFLLPRVKNGFDLHNTS